jgi:hypothetical protein
VTTPNFIMPSAGSGKSAPRLAFGLAILCLALAVSCREKSPFPGEVATVDGQSISFQDMESARSQLFSGVLPEAGERDDAVLRSQYRYVLGRLIEELVVCGYMKQNGLDIEPGALEAEERRIREDYPDGIFEDTLVAEGISPERWRQGLYRRLLVEQFMAQVLRPGISISSDEVQVYYRAHSDEFIIPEQWHFLQLLGQEKKPVEEALKSLADGRPAPEVQKEFPVSINDISMGVDLLPDDIIASLRRLPAGARTPVKADGKEFRAYLLLDKKAASVLDPAETSRRVEQVLAEEKMRLVYAAWMRNQLSKSVIRISPELDAEYPSNLSGDEAEIADEVHQPGNAGAPAPDPAGGP